MNARTVQTKRVIHEYGRDNLLHRIVVVEADGRLSEGDWCPYDALAHHRGYQAATPHFEGALPVGVFRINHIPHTKEQKEDTS